MRRVYESYIGIVNLNYFLYLLIEIAQFFYTKINIGELLIPALIFKV